MPSARLRVCAASHAGLAKLDGFMLAHLQQLLSWRSHQASMLGRLSLMMRTHGALEEQPLLQLEAFLAMMLAEACWAVMSMGCTAGLPLLSSKQAGP